MFEYIVNVYGEDLLRLILCIIAAFLARAAAHVFNDDTKRAIAKSAVLFVEQVWVELKGPEKLCKAMETAEAMLKKRGIKFDADDMMILIEAAVAEFNEIFKKPLEDEATAKAVNRPSEI